MSSKGKRKVKNKVRSEAQKTISVFPSRLTNITEKYPEFKIPSVDENNRVVCEICGRSYKTKHTYLSHLQYNLKCRNLRRKEGLPMLVDNRYTCEFCNKEFSTKAQLRFHGANCRKLDVQVVEIYPPEEVKTEIRIRPLRPFKKKVFSKKSEPEEDETEATEASETQTTDGENLESEQTE